MPTPRRIHKKMGIEEAQMWRLYAKNRTEKQLNVITLYYIKLLEVCTGRMAQKLMKPHDEMYSAGYIGLRIAITKFDLNKGFTFETFASHRISGSCYDWIREIDPMPRSVRVRSQLFFRLKDKLERKLGEELTCSEFASRMNLVDYDRNTSYYHVPMPNSLNVTSDYDGVTLEYMGAFEDDVAQPYDRMCNLESFNLLFPKTSYSKKERTLIYLHWWLGYNLKQAGKAIGCSASRASQIRTIIHKRLKDQMRSNPEKYVDLLKVLSVALPK